MKNLSTIVQSKTHEDLTMALKPSQNKGTFIRLPAESMKNDQRIRIYLGQVAERYDAVLKKSSQGFGLTLVDDYFLDNVKLLKVRSVYNNGPAAITGVIQAGDVISAFNHIDILGIQPEEVIKMFKVIKEKESITLTLWKLCETRPPYPYDPSYDIIHFYLQKCDSGFGFILGNCNEEHQVAKVNGDGDVNLLLRTNDKLLAIGQVSIENLTHDQVVGLLKKFPKKHFLQFTIRRDIPQVTRSMSEDNCQLMDYSMNSSIYSKVMEPNLYTQLPGIGSSGPFNTPDFIPASHYLSLTRRNLLSNYDNINYNSLSHPRSSFSTPNSPLTPEYRQPPDCIPEPLQSSIFSKSQSTDNIFVQINRSQTKGFGFRLMGGSDEACQVYIGAIVPGGPMDKCRLVECGDILTDINGVSTHGKSHAEVVSILEEAAKSSTGKLEFYIKKKRSGSYSSGRTTPKFDPDCRVVTLTRKPDEGFGFVIVSAVNSNEPCGIGRINPGSVADQNEDLHLGDRVLAVNGHSLQGLHYKDVMKIIKESDLQIELTVRSGHINSLKTIKYELANHLESLDIRSCIKQDSPTNTSNTTLCQPISIMKSTSQFDNLYKYNPKKCCIPLEDYDRSLLSKDTCTLPSQTDSQQLIIAELQKGKNGFGFSIRGGADFDNMSLYILKVSEETETKIGNKMLAGDQILEINSKSTGGMSHAAAVEEIQSRGDTVCLLLRRPS